MVEPATKGFRAATAQGHHRAGFGKMFMDRRTLLTSMVGLAGAGFAYRLKDNVVVGAAPQGSHVAAAQPARLLSSGSEFKSVSLAQVPVGAGGFVTGIDISSDGSRFVCRTDVVNGFIRDSTDAGWRPLFTPETMGLRTPADIPDRKDKADSDGVSGVRIAPSNKDVIYATSRGFAWRSSDGGRTIRQLALPQKRMLTNAGWQRLFNRTIDVHPRNAERVVVGTWGDGVWHSSDSGRTWKAADLPSSTKSEDDQPGINLVAYDPAANDRIFVFVTGVGLFRSDTGPGGAFQSLDGGPRYCSNMVIAGDSSIYLCERTKGNVGGKIYRFTAAGGWASSQPSHEALVMAVDPRHPERSVLLDPNGHFLESRDHCTTFQDRDGGKRFVEGGGEIRWMEGLVTAFPAELRFHPKRDELFLAQGVGVVRTDPNAANFVLSDWSAGIESLCITSALALSGGRLFLSALDKPFWRVTNLTSYSNDFRYPLKPGASHSANLVAYSSSLDVAGNDQNFLVGLVAPSNESGPGYSNDAGVSWREFESAPATGWGIGGTIAASTRTNFVLLPSNNAAGAFTHDGGRSWQPIKLNGTTPTEGFANAMYVPRRNISADKTRPGTFALVYTVIGKNQSENPLGGVWLTRDGGASWRRILTGVIASGTHDPRVVSNTGQDARQFWACQLTYVPGRSGELVYTGHADFKDDPFFWSQDDGATWTELHKTIRNVDCFGFGRAAVGKDRPSVYFSGDVNGQRGLYASFDWFSTPPKLVTRFPSEILSPATCITGDPDRLGRVFVGTGAAGCVRIDVQV